CYVATPLLSIFPPRRSSDLMRSRPLRERIQTNSASTVGTGRQNFAVVQATPILMSKSRPNRGDIFFAALMTNARSFAAEAAGFRDRKSTRLNSSHVKISYAV